MRAMVVIVVVGVVRVLSRVEVVARLVVVGVGLRLGWDRWRGARVLEEVVEAGEAR